MHRAAHIALFAICFLGVISEGRAEDPNHDLILNEGPKVLVHVAICHQTIGQENVDAFNENLRSWLHVNVQPDSAERDKFVKDYDLESRKVIGELYGTIGTDSDKRMQNFCTSVESEYRIFNALISPDRR